MPASADAMAQHCGGRMAAMTPGMERMMERADPAGMAGMMGSAMHARMMR